MPPKKEKQIVFPIESTEQLESIMAEDYKKLSVIDFHLSWCGPCTVMHTNYRTLYYGFEDAEKRVEFWTCDISLVPDELKEKIGTITCKPRFIVIVDGDIKANVDGVNFTAIEYAVTTFVPSLEE